ADEQDGHAVGVHDSVVLRSGGGATRVSHGRRSAERLNRAHARTATYSRGSTPPPDAARSIVRMLGPARPHPWGEHGGWHGPPWWAHEGPPRPPAWVTLWVPVLVSFLIQVPAAVAMSRFQDRPPREAAITILLAAAGPLLLIAARRFPG